MTADPQNLRRFKKLDHISHILKRPDTYIGSIFPLETSTFIVSLDGEVSWANLTYSPALLKIFDEVIQNCYDHSKRPEGKHINKIDVTINQITGEITVMDNGGIPVAKHPDLNQYIPDLIFGELMSGENYNEDEGQEREGAGTNGLGSKLTNIYSTQFKIETADGKKRYEKTYSDNRRTDGEEKLGASSLKYTKISFIPDYAKLNTQLDLDNIGMMIRRVYEIAAAMPGVAVTLNSKKLDVKDFETFAKKFSDQVLFTSNDMWRVALLPTGEEEGFRQLSLVNGTSTKNGGPHIDYIMDQVVSGIREYIKKKTKQDIKPSDLKNHFMVMIDATIINPRFTGQTKDILATPISRFGTSFRLDEKYIKRLLASPMVASILEWAERKKELDDARAAAAAQKANQKASLKHILKYEPANEKLDRSQCTLFICEGESAKNPLISARNPKLHGVYPLQGKPMNVRGKSKATIMANTELSDLMQILGLTLGFKGDKSELRYGRLAICADQDMDGHHVCGLTLNDFRVLWPQLVEQGFLYKMETPIIRVTMKGKTHEFFSEADFHVWAKGKTGFSQTYLKGLGGNTTDHFKKFMHDEQYLVPLTIVDESDDAALLVAFDETDSAADRRKQWLYS